MRDESDYILLKWGTIKGWSITNPEALSILKRYFEGGVSMSAMSDHPTAERREILCELIKAHEGDIQNDWSGEHLTKDQAMEYVRDYGR